MARQFCFTLDEIRRIMAATEEPYKMLFWLALETGMRAGESCATKVEDLALESAILHIIQSAWRVQLLDPKTAKVIRSFAISPWLVPDLRAIFGLGGQMRMVYYSPLVTALRGVPTCL